MKPLLENWKKFLKEELEHYTMEIQIKAEPNTQLYGSIFNKIRAIEGVTIIKSTTKMESCMVCWKTFTLITVMVRSVKDQSSKMANRTTARVK